MKTDQDIEAERQWLEPLIGPTRAEWYAEACRVEYDAPHDVVLWACRFREMTMEAGRLEAENAALRRGNLELAAARAEASEVLGRVAEKGGRFCAKCGAEVLAAANVRVEGATR